MPEIGSIIERLLQPIKPPIPKPVISNQLPTPAAEIDQVQAVINTLRKPEIRTPFSEILRSGVNQYFGEVLNQENPPELIQKFNEQKGIILLTGSTLRGTARTESSDLDVLILHDAEGKEPLERPGEHLLDRIVSSPDYHPDKISFPVWLARHLKNDPNLSQHYDLRRAAKIEQYKQSWGDEWKNRLRTKWERINKEEFGKLTDDAIVDHEIEQSFIFCEAEPVDINKLINAHKKIGEIPPDQFDIKNGSTSIRDTNDPNGYSMLDHYLFDAEVAIPELLTTTDQFSVAQNQDTLLHHQKRIVQSLDQLQHANPNVFQQLYGQLEKSFSKRDVVYEGGSHGTGAAYYRTLEKDYVVRSGRFSAGNTDRAARLLRTIKEQTRFPTIEEMKKHYLNEKYHSQKQIKQLEG